MIGGGVGGSFTFELLEALVFIVELAVTVDPVDRLLIFEVCVAGVLPPSGLWTCWSFMSPFVFFGGELAETETLTTAGAPLLFLVLSEVVVFLFFFFFFYLV